MSKPRSAPRRKVDGVLLLDKPQGLSSNTALQIARRLLNAEKAGHTGTLDPMATGLLPLCFGEATKFSSELLDADKAYEATLKLGVTTTTADAEGEVLQTRPAEVAKVTQDMLNAALAKFSGPISQVPPMYSALKRDGKPLYEYARAGVELEREARNVVIHKIELLGWGGGEMRDEVRIAVDCSKGTYIRTLAEDIGEFLGCGAHLTALRRTRIATITLAGAVTLEQLENAADRDAMLAATESLLGDLPAAHLDAIASERLLHGQAVSIDGVSAPRYRTYAADGRFIGLCQLDAQGRLAPKRLIAA